MSGGLAVLDAASLGEVAWVDRSATPRAIGVLPLLRDGSPVVALTFDRADVAVALSAADHVDLVLREPRNTAVGWRAARWRCRTRLVEDLDGDIWFDALRLQELRRYPPARRFADSPLLCREHWWYLPRLLVELEPEAELDPPAPRGDADDLLLVGLDERTGTPVTAGVQANGDRLIHHWGSTPPPGAALVLGQDATFPDLERWETWTAEASIGPDGSLVSDRPLPARTPPAIPGLGERWRAERRLAAACRRGLAEWTAEAGSTA